jgi:hypothetical protein
MENLELMDSRNRATGASSSGLTNATISENVALINCEIRRVSRRLWPVGSGLLWEAGSQEARKECFWLPGFLLHSNVCSFSGRSFFQNSPLPASSLSQQK